MGVAFTWFILVNKLSLQLHLHNLQPVYSFSNGKRIIFVAQFVDVDSVSILNVEHEIPGLTEDLLTLTALQVNFFALGCFLLKACCNK